MFFMNGDNGKLLKTQSLKGARIMHAQAFFQKKICSESARLSKYNLIFIKKGLTIKSGGCGMNMVLFCALRLPRAADFYC